jgi:hypothetical protein
MRLLKIQDYGSLSLVQHFGADIPRYAILSHTWEADDEEFSFKDITKNRGKEKAGYHKIRFCREQALQDGLRHFWVDTCCIKQESSQEVSEAINSMFRWYRNAVTCYVYLTDIVAGNSAGVSSDSRPIWIPAFRNSRWFTRGWTLQELLAPRSVEFSAANGERLGVKTSLYMRYTISRESNWKLCKAVICVSSR